MCARCLACGIECRYSPSTRAGKPKSDNSASLKGPVESDMAGLSPRSDDKHMLYSFPGAAPPELYGPELSWHTPPTSVDGGMSRSQSITSLGLMRAETSPEDMYPGSLSWSLANDMPAQFVEPSAMAVHTGHDQSQSLGFALPDSMPPWQTAPGYQDMFAYSSSQLPTPASISTAYFPSPTNTPRHHLSPKHKSASMGSSGSSESCTCFMACLQSLHALHVASLPESPPFDVVLSTNRKAVEGCASMLSCQRCMRRSGTHTTVMLLATVLGKVMSFYKNLCHDQFENPGIASATSPVVPNVRVGGYTLPGEDGRWFELEILARELRKLEEVYDQFREACAEYSDDAHVSRAMIEYLRQTLSSTMDLIHHRKADMYSHV